MRKDIAVYNEATGWTLRSADYGGRSRADVFADLAAAVEDHAILALRLVQDDPINVRVTDGKLSAQEEAEWVAKAVGRLRLSEAGLVLEGGFGEEERADFIQTCAVPPGDYRVEVYTLFWGINGDYCARDAGNYEPVGAWFRRTRPGKRFPALLQLHLCDEPDEDPGFEDKWDRLAESDRYDELEAPEQIDFLVRLQPWKDGGEPLTAPEEGRWLPFTANPRKPELCPVGVPMRE